MGYTVEFLLNSNMWHLTCTKFLTCGTCVTETSLSYKVPYSQSYVLFCFVLFFSSSHIQMWELDHKEGWLPKNSWFQIVVLRKTLESPLDCKIKPVNPKENQPWIFIGRTDAEALTLLPPDVKSHLTGKRLWCWEKLRAGGKRGDRGWDGWMASLTQWALVCTNSGR